MSKFIIHNNTSDLSDKNVLSLISKVVEIGKCSKSKYGEQYCFVTTFDNLNNKYTIFCDKPSSDTYTFRIINE